MRMTEIKMVALGLGSLGLLFPAACSHSNDGEQEPTSVHQEALSQEELSEIVSTDHGRPRLRHSKSLRN